MIFEENNIPYFQDMSFMRGIPTGINFQIKRDTIKEGYELVADKYGGKVYGNGSIFIWKNNLPKRLCKKIEKELIF